MAKGGARPGAGRPKTKMPPAQNVAPFRAPILVQSQHTPMSKKFIPTADQRGNVEAMIGFGIPEAEICRLLVNPETGRPIDEKTLRAHFANEIDIGQTKANANVGKFIYATITGGPGGVDNPRGRVDLAKFWAAMRMGWKSTTVHEHTGKIKIDARATLSDAIARIVASAAKSSGDAEDDGGAS